MQITRTSTLRSVSIAFAVLAASPASTVHAEQASQQLQGADPHAVFINGELWVFPTGGPTGWGSGRLGAWSSSDLKTWTSRGEIISRDKIRWFEADGSKRHYLWAPSIVQSRGRWYFYYSVGPQSPTPSRIGVAVADKPAGPYVDSGKPLLTGGRGFEAIDPMVFVDPRSRKPYLYAGGSAGAKLRVFELTSDMVSIKREISVKQPPSFTEAPFMHERNGIYYLSYSKGRWNNASYSVHYATARSPAGPWQYRGAILTSDRAHQGPGHHSFVQDPNSGEWLIVYHRYEGSNDKSTFAGKRRIAVDRVTYRADGTIRPIEMGRPSKSDKSSAAPPSKPVAVPSKWESFFDRLRSRIKDNERAVESRSGQ